MHVVVAAANVGDGAYCCDWTLVMVHMVVTVDVVAVADAGQKHANSCRSLQLQVITGRWTLVIDNNGDGAPSL